MPSVLGPDPCLRSGAEHKASWAEPDFAALHDQGPVTNSWSTSYCLNGYKAGFRVLITCGVLKLYVGEDDSKINSSLTLLQILRFALCVCEFI